MDLARYCMALDVKAMPVWKEYTVDPCNLLIWYAVEMLSLSSHSQPQVYIVGEKGEAGRASGCGQRAVFCRLEALEDVKR